MALVTVSYSDVLVARLSLRVKTSTDVALLDVRFERLLEESYRAAFALEALNLPLPRQGYIASVSLKPGIPVFAESIDWNGLVFALNHMAFPWRWEIVEAPEPQQFDFPDSLWGLPIIC